MQVINEHNWPERSLSYLCRSFDGLNRGDNYPEAKPVILVSLLDFTLFPERSEFYATYQLLNVKNYIKYSDKLCLHVLDLTRTDIATEEEKIRLQCEAREDYYRRQRDAEILRERQERKMKENEQKMRDQERQMQAQERQIREAQQHEQDINQQMNILKEENEQLTNQVNQLLAELEKLRTEQHLHH